ncbi:DsbA family protein [Sporolactobacillus sp. Y61]|uniref:DsbA family protein n=1 Tax=Sporolactobacillus sp. Y61 TaxID=3160863 RepID=A0AAU8IG47_9BACL
MSGKNKKSSRKNGDQEMALRRRRIVLFSLVVVVVLVAAITIMIYKYLESSQPQAKKEPPAYRTEQTVQINYKGQPLIGSTNAPVKIVEFADYRCPYCKVFEQDVVSQLKKEYIDTNKASFYFINYTILGPGSVLAASAAEEVYHQNPQGFWVFHKALYEAQGDENADKDWVTKDLLTRIAKKTVPSLDVRAFQSALDNQTHKKEIAEDNQLAEDLGVPGTPAVFVNGHYVEGSQDYLILKQAVDHALKEK